MALQVPPNCDLTLGLVCVEKSVPGRTVWRMTVDERFLNPAGIVQGGFLGAMMDSAMGASAVTACGDRKVQVANADMRVAFLRSAAPADVLTCVATVVKTGSLILFVEATITNQAGLKVATATSSYVVKERAR